MSNASDWDSPSSEERNWAMAAHMAPAAFSLISGGFGGIVVTFVIYLIKKDESQFIADAAREALNFQITVFLAAVLAVVMFLTGILACIGLPILLIIGLVSLILGIVAGVRASKGERYRYPGCLRLIS